MKKGGSVYIKKHEKMEKTITNEQVIAKVEKIMKQIDPNSKKQITELSENAQFKKMIEDIKGYVENYEEKDNFPADAYNKISELISYCDGQYKELTEKKVELQKQVKVNTALASILNEVYLFAITREDFSDYEKTLKANGLEEYINKLRTIATTDRKSEEYAECEKTVKSKINNLETNVHIEIDLERIEDKEKVLSYISIEFDNVLSKVTVQKEVTVEIEENIAEGATVEVVEDAYVEDTAEYAQYQEDVIIEVKESIWQRIMNSEIVQKIKAFLLQDVNLALPAALTGGTKTEE